MIRPTTVVDKNWWQRICERPEIADTAIATLVQKAIPCTPVALIEEVIANRFQPGRDQTVVARMIQAILGVKSGWIDAPSAIVFKELVKRERIENIGLPENKAKLFTEALLNPTDATFDLNTWMSERFREKQRRRDVRKTLHERLQKIVPERLLTPPDLETFAHNTVVFLKVIMGRTTTKELMLRTYVGVEWEHQHSAEVAEINEAFICLDYPQLLKFPATHSYLLTNLLYDLARITKIGLPQKGKSNPQVLSGSAINDSEDQQYLASALLCDRLLTCDAGLHQMANVFQEGRLWKGTSVFIPRDKVDQLESYFR